ncbi:MAG TPA: hypothetical protein VIN36_10790 [Thiobacillus sp.]
MDETKDLELRLDDGEAELIAHRADKSFDLTYSVDAQGMLVLHDESKELFTKDVQFQPSGRSLRHLLLDMHFIPLTEEGQTELHDRVAKHKAQVEARTANLPSSPDGYRLLTEDDLDWLMASRLQDQLSDENLAKSFIGGYTQATDAFQRKDLMASELPRVKAKIQELAAVQDFRIGIVSDPKVLAKVPGSTVGDLVQYTNPMIWEYNLDNDAFPITMGFGHCGQSGLYHQQSAAGINYTFRHWGEMGDAICQLKFSDESIARAVESARSGYDLVTHATVYFRFTGEKNGQGDFIMDPHRVDLSLYEAKSERGRGTWFEPIGSTITVTAPEL